MPSPFQIRQATRTLLQGGVISYPTESVFGLGCDPLSITSVYKILNLKQRPVDKGLILIASKLCQLEPYARLTPADKEKILRQKTPTTWLVKKSEFTPEWISGKHPKVAIRLSSHPTVKALCDELGGAIVSTSANPSSLPAARIALDIQIYFSDDIDYCLNGELGEIKNATPIIDIESGKFTRA